jgi:hypothetical protein
MFKIILLFFALEISKKNAVILAETVLGHFLYT